MDIALLARISLVPFMLLEIGIVGWYFSQWDDLPKYSVRRVLAWTIFMISAVALPLLQISIYRRLTSARRVEDPFVGGVILIESLVSVALAFYLVKRRSRAAGIQEMMQEEK